MLLDRHFVHYLMSEVRAAVALRRVKTALGGIEAKPFIPGDGHLLL